MRKSRLINLLKTLECKELEDFEKFLASPFYNTNKTYQKFYTYIVHLYPDFNSPKLDKEVVFPIFFPTVKPSTSDKYNRLRALMGRITEQLEIFLATKVFLRDKISQQKMLLKSFSNNSNAEEFTKTAEQLSKTLKKEATSDLCKYLDLHELHREVFAHAKLLNETRYISYLPILQTSTDYLDHYYQWAVLWKDLETINTNNFHLTETNAILPDTNFINKDSKLDSYLIKMNLYQQLYDFLKNFPTDERFEQVLALFKKNMHHLSLMDKEIIFNKLTNYCKRSPKTNQFNAKKTFEMYQFADEYKIYELNGKIHFQNFIIIVMQACMYNKPNWAHQYILENEKKIIPAITQKSALNLSYGCVYFYQKKFEEAKLHLNQQLDIPNLGFEVVARSLLLRTIYENWQAHISFISLDNHLPELKNNCRNFGRYLKSKDKYLHARRIEPYTILISFVKDLIKLKLKKSKNGIKNNTLQKHKKELLNKVKHHPFFASDWVRKKISQI